MEFDKLDFWSILNLNFAGYTGSENQFWNRPKIKLVEFHISNLIFQKSNADQQGERLHRKIAYLHKVYFWRPGQQQNKQLLLLSILTLQA